jgi:acetylornithine deacetylase/succinyl-diaminopimelate desuccinylase-like protein
MSEGDLKIMLELAKTFDIEEFKEILDVDYFYLDENKKEKGKDQLLFELFKPCLTIDGIISGYTEEKGSKTVLPCSAFANMDIRLVPDMEVEDTRTKIINFIKNNAPEAELDIEEGYKWAKTSPDHPYIKAHIDLLKSTGKEVQIWPMTTGSAPFYIFQEKFNIPFLDGGLGHGSRAHSPNEYAFLESTTGAGGILDFEISVARLLSTLGKIGKLKENY